MTIEAPQKATPDSAPLVPQSSDSETPVGADSTGYLPRELLLLGAGHAHVQVLYQLAREAPKGIRITLVAPHGRQIYSGMLPGHLSGRYALDDCAIALEPLVRKSGVRWLARSVRALDADAQTVLLDDGTTLHYDWLSINTGPVQNRAVLDGQMPGIREHGLFLRPLEGFVGVWPRVAELGERQNLRASVIGAGAAGVELALAIRQRLPASSVTLIGATPPGANYPAPVRRRILQALRARRIDVITEPVTAVTADALVLASGARLASTIHVVAIGAQAPTWLQASDLALDAQGFVAVDACQRSTSHPQVLAAGDVSTRVDRALARSGVYAVRAGLPLFANLKALVSGTALQAHQPPAHTLNLLSLGDGRAIASWGRWHAQGRLWWWLKDWIDRRFVRRYSVEDSSKPSP